MFKSLYLATLFFILTASIGFSQKYDTTFYDNGRVDSIYHKNNNNNYQGYFRKHSILDDSIVLVQGSYINGIKNGAWKENDSSFTYKNGIKNGPFFISNYKTEQGNYVNGKIEGDVIIGGTSNPEEVRNYKNGIWVKHKLLFNIMASKDRMDDIHSGAIKNNKRHGKWRTTNAKRVLLSTYEYDNGEKTGSETVYFPTGQIQSIIQHIDSESYEVKFYSIKGQLIATCNYVNDRVISGTYVKYGENYNEHTIFLKGEIIREELCNQYGKTLGYTDFIGRYKISGPAIEKDSYSFSRYVSSMYDELPEYYSWTFKGAKDRYNQVPEAYLVYRNDSLINVWHGGLQFKTQHIKDKEYNAKAQYSDGTIAGEGKINGNQTGNWRTYHPNGKLHTSLDLLEGTPNGLFMQFDSIGKCIDSINLINGLKHGGCLSFYDDRGTYIYAEYDNGIKHGKYREYDIDTIILGQYVNGKEHDTWKFKELDEYSPHYSNYYIKNYKNGMYHGANHYEKKFPNSYVFYENDVCIKYLAYDRQGKMIDSALVYSNYFNEEDVYFRPERFINTESHTIRYYKHTDLNPFGIKLLSYQYGIEECENPNDTLSVRYFHIIQLDTISKHVIKVSTTTSDWKGVSGYKNYQDSIENVYFPDGKIMSSENRKIKTEFYHNGKIKKREFIRSQYGEPDSIITYSPSGQVLFSGQWLKHNNNPYDGEWYWSNDDKTYTFHWDFNKQAINQKDDNEEKEGTWIYWDKENYTLDSIVNYRDGKLNGKHIDFNQWYVQKLDNQPSEITHYSNSKKDGLEYLFNRNGELIRETIYDRNQIIKVKNYPNPRIFIKDELDVSDIKIISNKFILFNKRNQLLDLESKRIVKQFPFYFPESSKIVNVSKSGKKIILNTSSSYDLYYESFNLFNLETNRDYLLRNDALFKNFVSDYKSVFHPSDSLLYTWFQTSMSENSSNYLDSEITEEEMGFQYVVMSLNDTAIVKKSKKFSKEIIRFTFLNDSVLVELSSNQIIYRDAQTFELMDSVTFEQENSRGVDSELSSFISNDLTFEIHNGVLKINGAKTNQKYFNLLTKKFITIKRKIQDLPFYKLYRQNKLCFVDIDKIYQLDLNSSKYSVWENNMRDNQNLLLTENNEWFYSPILYDRGYSYNDINEDDRKKEASIVGWYNIQTELHTKLNESYVSTMTPLHFENSDNLYVLTNYDTIGIDFSLGKALKKSTIPNRSFKKIASIQYIDKYRGGKFDQLHLNDGKSIKGKSSINLFNPLYPHKKGRTVYWKHFTNGESVLYSDDGYFMGNRSAHKILSFEVNGEFFPMEQFDLKYNRPDIMLSRLGYSTAGQIEQYKKAYQKRLKKMGFTENMLKADFHLPEAFIINGDLLPDFTVDDMLNLKLNIIDSKYSLDRINIWINNVPIYGVNGINLRSMTTQDFDTTIQLQLNTGDNKIEVSVLNQVGAESYKETVNINCTKQAPKPNLYFIGIGVKEFEDSSMNLSYSDKDIRDIADLYSTNNSFGKVFIDTFLNQRATKNIMPQIKNRLESTTIHDQVILMYSGHGILDDSLDYFLTTHDIDFLNPKIKGIPYEAIDALLDNIPARQKLVLIDACNSGEVDKEELTENKLLNNSRVTALRRAPKGDLFKKYTSKTNSFEMMQELFTDLRRGTGATVISSSSGKYFSYEDDKYQNGVYTYALKLGLEGEADVNNDNKITVSELKEYLYTKVESLTNGKQKPTARQENLEFDFRIW